MKKILLLIGISLLLVGCGKKSEMQNVIIRAENAISDMKSGKITMEELSEKLESINDYCNSYKNDDDVNESVLCTSMSLYEYEASMTAVSPTKKIDYQYWDKALKELNDYKRVIK